MTAGWTFDQVQALRDTVPAEGLNVRIAGHSLMDVARDIIRISTDGLKQRARLNSEGQDESIFLQPLEEILAKKRVLAEDLLSLYHGRWNGSVDPVFDEYNN